MQKIEMRAARTVNPHARVRHFVEAGQSLASIALKIYGDARFAKLIFTINRGEIPIRCDGFNTFAFVVPEQALFLPTREEAAIYEDHFFTESSRIKFDLAHYARPAMPSDNINLEFGLDTTAGGDARTDFTNTIIASALPSDKKAQDNKESQDNRGSNTDLPVFQSVTPKSAAAQPLPYLHVVQEAVNKPLSTFDMSPPKKAMPPLQVKIENTSGKEKQRQAELADDYELFFSQGTLEITSLSHYCRLMRFESLEADSDLMIKLQVFDQNKWQTIASYVVRKEASRRHAHYADGSSATVNIELPKNVVKELSVTDFNRNWKNYTKVYFNHSEKIRLEQLTAPAKMMLHAV